MSAAVYLPCKGCGVQTRHLANLLSMATSYAEAHGASTIFIGAHSEGFAGYPDCRPAFFEAFQQVIDVGTKPDTEISLEAPFVEWSKTDIAERGLGLGVPYEYTWSCYREEAPACGTVTPVRSDSKRSSESVSARFALAGSPDDTPSPDELASLWNDPV